jgi:hypothetical protein
MIYIELFTILGAILGLWFWLFIARLISGYIKDLLR